jgi:predicted transcriptional regulator
MNDKILEKYTYEGFGFPIELRDVHAKKIRGEWIPFINFSDLARSVLRILCFREEPLTGNEIFFIRQLLGLTGNQLADLLGITQAAVSKWEKKGNEIAKMEPAIEFCLRFIALEHLEKGSSASLRKMFLEKHFLIKLKEKQKNKSFTPSSLGMNCRSDTGR